VARGLLVATSLAALALALPSSAPSASAAPALHVIPFPGTPDASPSSEIIFSSLRPSDLNAVSVNGSTSGPHLGQLGALADAAGTTFTPDHAFTAGERVSVTAVLNSPAAGTASGDPGATSLHFSFTIAVPATEPPSSSNASGVTEKGPGSGLPPSTFAANSPPERSFHSALGIHPPPLNVTSDPDQKSGDIFLSLGVPTSPGQQHYAQNGTMILDSSGRLVWFRPVSGYAMNLEVQRYRGQPVLTWWQQTVSPAHRLSDADVIMNRSYQIVATLHGSEGYFPDVHEFQLTTRDTALTDSYPKVVANLTQIGGPKNGPVADCVIQEVDVRTGQLLWEWHALGHIPVTASYAGRPTSWPPYGLCHLNSIQELPNGNLLISARNTWAVYEINKQTGRIIWTLGGKQSSFKMGPGTNFEWQHDAHLTGDTLSVFDDAALPQEERQSSAKLLRLNTSKMTAVLVRRYVHTPPILAGYAGSVQRLPNGNVFVGWGANPTFSEYRPNGRQIFTGSFPYGAYSYRAYRFPWPGQPTTRPSLAVTDQPGGAVKIYASWNGATQVRSWRVIAGGQSAKLRPAGQFRQTGFETEIALPGRPRYVAVQALNARGRVIGTSATKKA
jgi:hypothetical protein